MLLYIRSYIIVCNAQQLLFNDRIEILTQLSVLMKIYYMYVCMFWNFPECLCVRRKSSSTSSSAVPVDPTDFKLQRALLVSKLSRYEFEQLRHPNLSPEQLETKLRDRGTDFDTLMYLHNLHKDFESTIVKSFRDVGCEVKLANR